MGCDEKRFSRKKYFSNHLLRKLKPRPVDFYPLLFSILLIQELRSAGKKTAAVQKLYFQSIQISMCYFKNFNL